MKLINKTLALVLACSIVGLAQAGSFEWRIKNLTQSLHTYELEAAIRQGLSNSDSSLPDLPKPWVLSFTLAGTVQNDNSAEYGLIVIEKSLVTQSDLRAYVCRRFEYGTFTKTGFLEALRAQAKYAAGYATTNPECFVNDPEPVAPPAAPAKKSSKK